MAEKIKLITHLGISGDMDLNVGEGGKRVTFKLSPYRLSTGQVVGEFDVTPAQLKAIKETKHWKMTYIQLRDEAKGTPESENPANNQVHVGTVINPLGFSAQQVQIIDNALLVKPALREILADNVLDACMKILDAEKLPLSEPPVAGAGAVPTSEEILAMKVPALKSAFKNFGGKYNTKLDADANRNALMDLIASKT